MGTLDGRIIALTGASRGIGAGVAVRLASEGARLVLIARSLDRLEAVDDRVQQVSGQPATLVACDLADHDKIDALGAGVLARFGHLDGFIGNAATLGQITPLAHLTPKQFQSLMDVNVTANWRLLRIFDPLLRRAPAGRVALVTSGVTQAAFPYWGAYAASKAALESLAYTYAAEVAGSALRVNLIDPGVVATDMRAQAFPGEDKTTLRSPDDPALTGLFVQAMAEDCTAHGQRLTL